MIKSDIYLDLAEPDPSFHYGRSASGYFIGHAWSCDTFSAILWIRKERQLAPKLSAVSLKQR